MARDKAPSNPPPLNPCPSCTCCSLPTRWTHFKVHKDTTFSMMREAAAARPPHLGLRGPQDIAWAKRRLCRCARRRARSRLTGRCAADWFAAGAGRRQAHGAGGITAPSSCARTRPLTAEYIYATHLLEQAEREGAHVINRAAPRCATTPRSWPIMEFAQFMRADAGHAQLKTRVRPLSRGTPRHHPEAAGRHGRRGHLPRARTTALNLGSIIETLNRRRHADGDGAEASCPSHRRRATSAS
jgi:glutathione synthase